MDEGSRKAQYFVSFSVSLGALMIGLIQGWATPAIPKIYDHETNLLNVTDNEISWMLSLTSPGYMTGSFVTTFTSDRFGRRTTILGSAIPNIIATVILVNASQAWMLYVTRFLFGLGMGMIGSVSIIYLAEISNKEIRGTLTAVYRFMQDFGVFIMMAVGSFVSFQVLNYTLLVIPVIYFIACWWIPESPYYLLKEGRVDVARRELMKLNGYRDEKVLDEKLSSMQTHVKIEMQNSSSFKELVTGKQYRKAIVIDIGLKLTQVMSGTLVIQQYVGRIMQETATTIKVSTAIIIFGAVRFIVSLMASTIIDRAGRRPLLIFSYFGSSVVLAIVGTYFFFQDAIKVNQDILTTFGFVPFVGIICYYVIASSGYNVLAYVIPAEIFPLNIKSVAIASLSILSSFCNFLVFKSYQDIKNITGLYGAFWFFTSVSLIGGVFSYFFVPETKGKSLREIQMELQGDLYDHNNENLKPVVTKLLVDEDAKESRELKELGRKETLQL